MDETDRKVFEIAIEKAIEKLIVKDEIVLAYPMYFGQSTVRKMAEAAVAVLSSTVEIQTYLLDEKITKLTANEQCE